MRVLIIPDIHEKEWILKKASYLMKKEQINRAVCLMDIPDDWHEYRNTALLEATYNIAIRFAEEYPETLWCFGDHELRYLMDDAEGEYVSKRMRIVREKTRELAAVLPDKKQLAVAHRIDNVLFVHGGLSDSFVTAMISDRTDMYDDVDSVLSMVNSTPLQELYAKDSPLYYRPQMRDGALYMEDSFLQVVGHTPVKDITRKGNVLFCDVFATRYDYEPLGSQRLVILDTKTGEYETL